MRSTFPSPWLGPTRGYLSDWVTQQWVRLTGQRVELTENHWLDGPIGSADKIGENYFPEIAATYGLDIRIDRKRSGLFESLDLLNSHSFHSDDIQGEVREFYERTSDYELDVWAEWSGFFRPFGRLLAYIFSRRLQQLNLPLSSLETSRGMSSRIIELVEPSSGMVKLVGWLRTLIGTGNVLYAGSYSVCKVPGFDGNCVKIVFPLPNGNATVIMRPEKQSDGTMKIVSSGQRFGDPGFYLLVRNANGTVTARYVRGMRETIHVYAAEGGSARADHILTLFNVVFLRLHYRMTKKRSFGG